MKKSKLLLLLTCICFSFLGFAQKKVSGKVTDSQGIPMPGVSLLAKNTKTGTLTDFEGQYNLVVPTNSNVIVFSYIGMKTQEVEVNQKSIINVKLEEEASVLDEIVVIGYGTSKKKDLTGSVSSIKANKLAESSSTNIFNAMQGRVAGVAISSESGEPGGGMNIRIRGANSISGSSTPLFVIDGVQLDFNKNEVASTGSSQSSMNPLSMLNPNDIESIEVLKDASSTAIYGSRGANGVVIVTTKSGKNGKANIEYEVVTGLSTANNKINVLSPEGYLQYAKARGRDSFLLMDTNGDGILDSPRDFTNTPSHIWQDEALRTAEVIQHTLSMSGGNDKSNYSAGIGYVSEEGLVRNNDFERYNFRLQANQIHSDRLRLGFNLNSSLSEAMGVANNGGPNSYSGVTQLIVMANPWEITDPDVNQVDDSYISPLKLIDESDKTTRMFRSLGSLDLQFKLTKDLTYVGVLGGNYSNSKLKEFYNSRTNWGNYYKGLAGVDEVETYSYNHSSQLNYKKKLKKHYFDVLAAFEVGHYNWEQFRNRVAGFEDESTGVNDIQKGKNLLEYTTKRYSTSRLSYLSRVNYNYNNRYFFTASFRADGSDKFGEGNRWGYFPSGALAWKISEENFLKEKTPISNLKLRLSYGETGNESIPAYSNFAKMENTYYSNNESIMFGMSPSSRENPELKWETTKQFNTGVDLGLFNNRLNINVDYYKKQTENMLLLAPVSSQTGYFNQWLNIGNLENSGFEFTLSTVNINKQNFKWESNFNISFNKNQVTDIGRASFINIDIPGGFITNPGRIIVGEPIGIMYGYVFDGVYQIDQFNWQNNNDPTIPHSSRIYSLKQGENKFVTGTAAPGSIRYKDISGPNGVPDGKIDDVYDRTVIGHSNPKHFGGFNNNFTYKSFDLAIFFEWSYGNDIFNASKLNEQGILDYMNVTSDYFYNSWTPTNPSNKYPGIAQISTAPSSYFVEDGSYLRLKNISLGYKLPKEVLDQMGISALRVFATGTNLITWTKYTGLDPEVNSTNPLMTGFDRFSYPRARTINLGLNVKF